MLLQETNTSKKPYDELTRTEIVTALRRNLPARLRALHAFVVFKFAPPKKLGGKRAKLPFYVVGKKVRSGTHDTPEDRSHLVSFAEAVRLLETDQRWNGIGVCALKENGLFFIDVDNCLDPTTGELNALAAELLAWRTYTELSPSGRGLRMVMRGNPGINTKNHSIGLELFCNKGFVTLTGRPFSGSKGVSLATPARIERLHALLDLHHPVKDRQNPQEPRSLLSLPNALTEERYRDVKEAIKRIDPDCGYGEWLSIGQALHSGSPGSTGKGFKLWLHWSRKGAKFEGTSEQEMLRKWQGFKSIGGITLATLFGIAKASDYKPLKLSIPDGEITSYTPKTTPIVDTKPLVPGLFDHYGAYMFIGRAKIGKSRVLGSIIAGALCGGTTLGLKFVKKCKVLALSLEEDSNTLLERIRAYAVEPNDHENQLNIIDDRLLTAAAKKHNEDYTWNEWLHRLLKQFKPNLVYLDTSVKFRMVWQNEPAYRTKNITEQDYQNAGWLDQAAQKHKCVIISVIHGSKRKNIPQHNFDPFESIGTTSWTLAGCTGALALMDKPGSNPMEEEDDGQRVFSVRGRYMPRGDKHYIVQSNPNGTFTSLGEYHQVATITKTTQFLECIAQGNGEPVTARTIALECGSSVRTVYTHLKKFINENGVYQDRNLVGVQNVGYRLVAIRKTSKN